MGEKNSVRKYDALAGAGEGGAEGGKGGSSAPQNWKTSRTSRDIFSLNEARSTRGASCRRLLLLLLLLLLGPRPSKQTVTSSRCKALKSQGLAGGSHSL
eukprot:evm.model.NODE_39824_length_45102_cov_22.830252.12